MPVRSAGILLYRLAAATGIEGASRDRMPESLDGLQVWIAHMGGPFSARKDTHAWSIPKGEYTEGEDPLAAALREFAEEMGTPAPAADYLHLGEFRQPSGKVITVFAAEQDFRPEVIESNTFPLEWPPRSGKFVDTPEVDRGEWFDLETARQKINPAQAAFLDQLESLLES